MTEVDGGGSNGGVTYTYDALNRRVRIDNGSSDAFEYIYDTQGRHRILPPRLPSRISLLT